MFHVATGKNYLPFAATPLATEWDILYWFLVIVSVVFAVPIIMAMVYFCFRYRYDPQRKPSTNDHNTLLEVTWTVIPTILLLLIFAWGWVVYDKMTSVNTNAYHVNVIGKQWLWEFHYKHGERTVGDLYLPANRPIRLVMTATDVIHSFSIPDFRLKQDVVPGLYTEIAMHTEEPGEHIVYCAEYCGTSHSGMLATIHVLPEGEWQQWLAGESDEDLANLPPAELGKRLFEQNACNTCHSLDGSRLVGPSMKGIWGREEEFEDGSTLVVDENYLRESILNPNAKIVKGYRPMMPSFQGALEENEVMALIEYMKTIE